MDKVLIEKWYKERKSGGLAIWVNTPDDAAHKRNIIASVYTYEQDKHADLILEAVNACKAINPDNPIKVAESLPDLFAELTKLKASFYMDICRAYNAGKENMRNTDIVNYM